MDETYEPGPMGMAFDSVEQAMATLRGQLEHLKLRGAIDPDGELAATYRMLRLKRGSRRG